MGVLFRRVDPPEPSYQKGTLSNDLSERALLRGSLFATLTAAVFVLGGVSRFAPSHPRRAESRPQSRLPKPAAPAPAPASTNQAPAAPQPHAQAGQGNFQLVFSPWTKFCSTPGQNGQDANTPKVCSTVRDGSTETGIPVLAVALIEPDGAPRKSSASRCRLR